MSRRCIDTYTVKYDDPDNPGFFRMDNRGTLEYTFDDIAQSVRAAFGMLAVLYHKAQNGIKMGGYVNISDSQGILVSWVDFGPGHGIVRYGWIPEIGPMNKEGKDENNDNG